EPFEPRGYVDSLTLAPLDASGD
ncbi:hypothetical protein LCGC14_1146120, partial [marine sediment metagenome]